MAERRIADRRLAERRIAERRIEQSTFMKRLNACDVFANRYEFNPQNIKRKKTEQTVLAQIPSSFRYPPISLIPQPAISSIPQPPTRLIPQPPTRLIPQPPISLTPQAPISSIPPPISPLPPPISPIPQAPISSKPQAPISLIPQAPFLIETRAFSGRLRRRGQSETSGHPRLRPVTSEEVDSVPKEYLRGKVSDKAVNKIIEELDSYIRQKVKLMSATMSSLPLRKQKLVLKWKKDIKKDVGHLYLVDKYLPPTAFLRMLDALPEQQKSHMMELALDKKTYELNSIMEGILSVLPTQDREDSRRFMELLNALSCWSDVLYEASAPLYPFNIDLKSSGKVTDKRRRNRVPLSPSLIAKLESKNVKI
ncbi:unnamed protein product [Auanema sp. JU1783]|nr:unnamed protein product [Auanema sp. JU1783]